jgi:hypothetical protein
MKPCVVLVALLLALGCERVPSTPNSYGVGPQYGGPNLAFANAQGGSNYLGDFYVPDGVETSGGEEDVLVVTDLSGELPAPDEECVVQYTGSIPEVLVNQICICYVLNAAKQEEFNDFCECTLAWCVDQPEQYFADLLSEACKTHYPTKCK